MMEDTNITEDLAASIFTLKTEDTNIIEDPATSIFTLP
jgi:hypothetical protein